MGARLGTRAKSTLKFIDMTKRCISLLAEGEELGSNLLRVDQSSLGDPRRIRFPKRGRPTQLPRSGPRWLHGPTACRAPAASRSIAPTSARQTPDIGAKPRS